jgi:hypothetical protein
VPARDILVIFQHGLDDLAAGTIVPGEHAAVTWCRKVKKSRAILRARIALCPNFPRAAQGVVNYGVKNFSHQGGANLHHLSPKRAKVVSDPAKLA